MIQAPKVQMSGLRVFMAVLALPMASAAAQVRTALSAAEQGALAELGPQFARELALRHGWVRGQPITYYDIGVVDRATGTVTIPVSASDTAGAPRLSPGARPIFSTLPGVGPYSGVWLVQYLLLPDGARAGAIRDARVATAMVLRGEARFLVRRVHVNLPILPAGSFLAEDSTGRALQNGWYRGVAVRYMDFGVTDVASAPIYAAVKSLGADGPAFVREQHNIVDVVPGDTNAYTDFWDVEFVIVDDRFLPQAWRSRKDLLAGAQVGGYRIVPGELRNCPVVTVDGHIAARTPVPWTER